MKKRGLIVFISDFLAPIESFGEQLATLRAYGHECQIFHILDPVERYFTFEGAIQFEDQETGRDVHRSSQGEGTPTLKPWKNTSNNWKPMPIRQERVIICSRLTHRWKRGSGFSQIPLTPGQTGP